MYPLLPTLKNSINSKTALSQYAVLIKKQWNRPNNKDSDEEISLCYISRCLLIEFLDPPFDVSVADFKDLPDQLEQCSSD